jgi:hypothetical protein
MMMTSGERWFPVATKNSAIAAPSVVATPSAAAPSSP